MTADIENRLQQIASVITQLDDQKVPRNIRKGAKDAVEKWLLNKNKQLDVRIAMSQAKLEELYEDPNIPMEFGTLILQINTALEQMLTDLHSWWPMAFLYWSALDLLLPLRYQSIQLRLKGQTTKHRVVISHAMVPDESRHGDRAS